jgi:DNA-binding NtrC family response regulator
MIPLLEDSIELMTSCLSSSAGRSALIFPTAWVVFKSEKKMILTALRRGAFDYQLKPISAQELKRSVDRALEHYQLIRDRNEKLKRLSRLEEGAGLGRGTNRHRYLLPSMPSPNKNW